MALAPRVAVVGLGGMGTRHANALREVDGTVVAGADVHEATRDSFAERFDAEPFADHEAMLEETSPDAVIVATPNRYHEPVTTSALARDVHVLCEKPLAHSVESAERIVEADDESDAFCMVGFCHRFSAATRLFRAQYDAGTFGTVTHVEANFVRRRGIPNLGSWFTDQDLAGGGALMDLGVHTIDLALYLAGYPSVVEVTGHTTSTLGGDGGYADPDGWAEHRGPSGTGLDVEEAVSAYLRCDDGTTVSLEVAWAANRRSTKRFRVDGTDAGAELELGGHTLDVVAADGERGAQPVRGGTRTVPRGRRSRRASGREPHRAGTSRPAHYRCTLRVGTVRFGGHARYCRPRTRAVAVTGVRWLLVLSGPRESPPLPAVRGVCESTVRS